MYALFPCERKNLIVDFLLYNIQNIQYIVNCNLNRCLTGIVLVGTKLNSLDQTFLYLILKKYVKKVTTALSGIFVMLFIPHYNTNCNNRFYNLDDLHIVYER